MAETSIRYVEQTDAGSWRVAGSRVSIDSVIYLYRNGTAPGEIERQFPSLSAEQVHGTIAFYLHNQSEIDDYLTRQQNRRDELMREAEADPDSLRDRMRKYLAERSQSPEE